MPVTDKGRKILSAMKEEYGPSKGTSIFYASANKGRITGVHKTGDASGARPRILLRDSLRQGRTFDEAMNDLSASMSGPEPTMDAKAFRRAFKDAIAEGKAPRQALEMGCISGVKQPNPTPESEASSPTRDSRTSFRDSFRKLRKAGKSTRDAMGEAMKDWPTKDGKMPGGSVPSLAAKQGVTQ